MFRFSQYGWYKSLLSNNSRAGGGGGGAEFAATTVDGQTPDNLINQDRPHQRIILNPMESEEIERSSSTVRLIKKHPESLLDRIKSRLPFIGRRYRGAGYAATSVLMSQPMSTGVSQSSLIYAQLDEDQQRGKASNRASLSETVQSKLKLKRSGGNAANSEDESDREEILMEDMSNRSSRNDSNNNDERVYLDLSKVMSSIRP